MTDQTDLNDQPKFTGKHMLIVMLSFFGVIIAVNLTMATLATKSWTGLVVKNGYIASQHFNKNQKAQEDLVAAGWNSELLYEDGTFILSLKKNSTALANCQVTGLLNRPVHENANQHLFFTYKASETNKVSGDYLAYTPLKPGRWHLNVQAICPTDQGQANSDKKKTDKFIQTYKFIAPEQSPVK